jgi:adenosylcobinamide kinase / adenosylcobinamide-phosphate guanylyltransferase
MPAWRAGSRRDAVVATLTFVVGGARSGKSRFAEEIIAREPPPWIYVATATALDAEMAERIALHQARRRGSGKSSWQTVEEPHDLARVLSKVEGAALVDCLTLWLSNRMLAGADIAADIAQLEAVLERHKFPLAVVANDVGSGVVPDNALARRFRDWQGSLNQRVAAQAARVVLMVAGLPLFVKGNAS